jgi:hypothetical protein
MEGGDQLARLRSFALGGVLGAAGAIATVRRRAASPRRPRPAGPALAAFEDAPCFLELVEAEARRHRVDAGGSIERGDPNDE